MILLFYLKSIPRLINEDIRLFYVGFVVGLILLASDGMCLLDKGQVPPADGNISIQTATELRLTICITGNGQIKKTGRQKGG